MRPRAVVATGLASVLLGLLLNAAPAHAAAVTVNLCADEGSVTLPGTALPVPIWGFVQDTGSGCPAAGAIPGPQLTVNAGDVVTINLTNNLLADNVSLVFPGQNLVPDITGVTPGGTKSYSFTASSPGTYLYESGVSPGVQLPMGLYGALVVRPVSAPNTPILNRAYNDISTLFNSQAVLVLSDIDPNLNNSPDPNAFNMVNYNPTYWLINGKAYPDTAVIPVAPGQRLLLRYVNAGSTNSSMTLLNLRQRLIALDAFAPSPSLQTDVVSQTIASGQTADTIVIGPTAPGGLPLYNRQMHITNGLPHLDPPPAPGEDRGIEAPHFPGGMMTFISVPALLSFSTGAANVIPGVLAPHD
ncbi:MAG: multicopper oxidase domain-containing protein, partial [Hypericibacter sp.]